MKKLIYTLSGVVILFVISSCQENKHAKNYNSNSMLDSAGTAFIKNGLEAGLTEIKAAKVAESNSKDTRVIDFAAMMIADHTKAGDELEEIAIKNRVTGSDSVSTGHQKMIMGLTSKLGAIFDGAYMQMMITDHEGAVKLFTEGTKNTNPEIQSFAKKILPTLQMHLDSAKAINASLSSK